MSTLSEKPAQFSPLMLRRPQVGWFDARTTLRDFAIITYAVEPKRLARHLAPGFEPDVFVGSDGEEMAFVSAVSFRNDGFHFRFAPFYKVSMGQTNYRAYVRYKQRRVVWFFGTTLGRFWSWVPRHLWRLPWHRARYEFDTIWEEERCQRYRLETKSAWGPASVELEGSDEPTGCLEGFRNAEETAVVLTHPLEGYYHRRDGKVGSYSIWHDRLALCRAAVKKARFPAFERLDFIEEGDRPHSALVQRKTEFIICLPPRVVDEA